MFGLAARRFVSESPSPITAPTSPTLEMVVSLGHCSCGPPGAGMMANGSMRMLDPQTNAWVTVPYDREGTGMDYITGNLVRRSRSATVRSSPMNSKWRSTPTSPSPSPTARPRSAWR